MSALSMASISRSARPICRCVLTTDFLADLRTARLTTPVSACQYWRQYFSRISEQQCGVGVDWNRPYIMQVARFDPSKGADSGRLPSFWKKSTAC
jgi:hypothetical protein